MTSASIPVMLPDRPTLGRAATLARAREAQPGPVHRRRPVLRRRPGGLPARAGRPDRRRAEPRRVRAAAGRGLRARLADPAAGRPVRGGGRHRCGPRHAAGGRPPGPGGRSCQRRMAAALRRGAAGGPGHVPAGHLCPVLPLDGPASGGPGGARHAHAGRRLRSRARHHPPRDRDRGRAAVPVAAVPGAGRAEPPLPRPAAGALRGTGTSAGSPRSTAPPGSAGRPRSRSRGRSSRGPSRRSSPPTSPCRARRRTCSATGWPGSSTRLAPCCTAAARRGSSANSCAKSPPTSGGGRTRITLRPVTARPVRPATPGRPAERDRPGDAASLATDGHPDRRTADLDRVRVQAAAERARVAQVGWAARPVEERAELLLAFHDAVLDRRDALVNLVQTGGGKARLSATEEVLHVALTARYYGRTARRYLHSERGSGVFPVLTRIDRHYVPKGLVGVIAPWNYPLTMADLRRSGRAGRRQRGAAQARPADPAGRAGRRRAAALGRVAEPDLWPVVHGEGSVVGPQRDRRERLRLLHRVHRHRAEGRCPVRGTADRLLPGARRQEPAVGAGRRRRRDRRRGCGPGLLLQRRPALRRCRADLRGRAGAGGVHRRPSSGVRRPCGSAPRWTTTTTWPA